MSGNQPVDSRVFQLVHALDGTSAATAADYGKFFVACKKCVVRSIREVHTVKGSDGSAVTLMIERLQGTETSGNGDDLLTSAFNLKGTAETVQSGTLTTTVADLILTAGDRLNLVDTGVLTAVDGVCVTVELQQIN
ncbi:MAG: hypothetical protein P9X24_04600 [Candidatus Hatepunaea meridiana]|nr:hypothetical protein [Candidatus Hatepunaea meridiana]